MTVSAVEFKGTSFTISVIHLVDSNLENLAPALKSKITQAPSFFQSAPVVVNVSQIQTDIDYNLLRDIVESTGLRLVGITGHKGKTQREQIHAANLAVMTTGQSTPRPTKAEQPKQAETPTQPAQQLPPKVVRGQIRSGQQVYAKDSDLVVIGSVGNGAEVIADGNIHIYGTLRGRAIAGASGQAGCGIFCQNLQAELVSIAGHYQLSDSLRKEWQQACSIELKEQHLKFAPLY